MVASLVLVLVLVLALGLNVILTFDRPSDLWIGVGLIVVSPMVVLVVRRYRIEFGAEAITLQWLFHRRVIARTDAADISVPRHPVHPWALAGAWITLRHGEDIRVPTPVMFWRSDVRRTASLLRTWGEEEVEPVGGGS